MGTRSRAYIETREENKHYFKGISIHFDGYPSWVGLQLLKHYNSPEKFNELLDTFGGFVSSIDGDLKTTLEENENYEKSDLLTADYSDPLDKDSLCNPPFIEWVYLFKDGKWYFFKCGYKSEEFGDKPHGELTELTDEAIETYRNRA